MKKLFTLVLFDKLLELYEKDIFLEVKPKIIQKTLKIDGKHIYQKVLDTEVTTWSLN
jgi:hypothetical protein